MRNDKLIPGTVLVIIGALFLLNNFGVINFSWFALIHLWPIFLVIAGVNLVFANNRTGVATAVKIGVLVAGMAFLIIAGLSHNRDSDRNDWRYAFRHFDYNDDNNNDTDTAYADNNHTTGKGSGHYSEAYKPTTKTAILNISGGATSYYLKDVSNELFEADTKEFAGVYNMNTNSDSTSTTVNFNMDGDDSHRHHHGMSFVFGNNKTNKAYLKINTNPEWEINVEAGAAKVDFDLTNYKVKKLKLEGGAASFNVKMGQPLAQTNLDISTGISKVTISIPKNAACSIETDAGISSKTFNGFQNMGDNEFQTPGFDNAINKMYIKLSGGISDFKVNRY